MTQVRERTTQADPDRYDFTRPHRYPRSGRELLDGVVYLARAVDKARADINGTAGEYIWACPQSRKVYDFLGVSPEAFREAVEHSPTDEGVVEWLHTHGASQHTDDAKEAFNQEMLEDGPSEDQMDWFQESLEKMGQGHRRDVKTFVDMQDLEEERL